MILRSVPWGRLLGALFFGVLVGVVVAGLSNRAINGSAPGAGIETYVGFWGSVYGSFAGVIAIGLTLSLKLFPGKYSIIGWRIASGALALFAAGVIWWIVMWGFLPWSADGALYYGLAVSALLLAASLPRLARTLRRNDESSRQ